MNCVAQLQPVKTNFFECPRANSFNRKTSDSATSRVGQNPIGKFPMPFLKIDFPNSNPAQHRSIRNADDCPIGAHFSFPSTTPIRYDPRRFVFIKGTRMPMAYVGIHVGSHHRGHIFDRPRSKLQRVADFNSWLLKRAK